MKLREEEFYNQYHQHGGTTIIPTEIFNELYDDATEEIERLKEEYVMLQNASDEVEEEKDREIERLNGIIEIKTNRIQDLMKRLSKRTERIEKAIEFIETHQLNFKKGTTTFGSERLSMEERKLLDILRGVDKE